MAVSAELEGFENVQKKIEELGRKGSRIANKALADAAQPILEEAKNTRAFRRITGRLRAKLEIGGVHKKGGIRYREIGIFADHADKKHPFYAKFHEYGTSHERAHPFLGPAYEKRKREAYTILKEQIKKELGL